MPKLLPKDLASDCCLFLVSPHSCYNLQDLCQKLGKTMDVTSCIFCDIVSGSSPASIVYADDQVMAFMDIQPVNAGHLLIVPRTHAAFLSEMDRETGGHMFRTAMRLAEAVRQSDVRCEGINLFLADGESAGQEVFHVHLHLIPRFRGDGFGFRFGPEYSRLPDRAALDELAERIRRELGG